MSNSTANKIVEFKGGTLAGKSYWQSESDSRLITRDPMSLSEISGETQRKAFPWDISDCRDESFIFTYCPAGADEWRCETYVLVGESSDGNDITNTYNFDSVETYAKQ